jgi:hypothetical protein
LAAVSNGRSDKWLADERAKRVPGLCRERERERERECLVFMKVVCINLKKKYLSKKD